MKTAHARFHNPRAQTLIWVALACALLSAGCASRQGTRPAWPRLTEDATLHIPVAADQYVEFSITPDGFLTAGANGKISGPFAHKGVKAAWRSAARAFGKVEGGTYRLPEHASCALLVVVNGHPRRYICIADPTSAAPPAPPALKAAVLGISGLLPR